MEMEVFDRALALAVADNPAPRIILQKTKKRTITRRGVIWLGQTCNLHCEFCYFIDKIHSKTHPEHAFMAIDKAKKICRTLVEFYCNSSVDIQGGEPTIYKDIFNLIHYCREIGLMPTLITNALKLDNFEVCQKYRDAGIRDFLISIHGLGETYDMLVGLKGAHIRQMKALRNLQKVNIPFRLNCVLTKPVMNQLRFIAELAVKVGTTVVNFIAFNPFADQSRKGRRSMNNVPKYSEIREKLTEALDILEDADIEANVRYLPLCMMEERHRKLAYNFQQLPYDHHEWDYASWAWTGLQPQRMKEEDITDPMNPSSARWMVRIKKPFKCLSNITLLRPVLYKAHRLLSRSSSDNNDKESLYRKIARLHAEVHCKYAYGIKCNECMAKDICDGFHGDYAAMCGTDEARPVLSTSLITEPTHYIRRQKKIVEKEDEGWTI